MQIHFGKSERTTSLMRDLWFDLHAKSKFTTKMQIYEKLSYMRGFAWLAVKESQQG